MNVIETSIPDVLIFEPKIFGDERGYFFEAFRQDQIQEYIGNVNFVQDNESCSSYGVLRGLHFQRPPYTQSKLVRVIKGEVLDVAVDIRIGSPWYGQHVAVNLTEKNKRQLWIPQGFAHGFVVLSDTAVFSYKCDNYYAPNADGGITWNDPQININWQIPTEDIILSEKDKKHPSHKEVKDFSFQQFSKEKVYEKECITLDTSVYS